MDKPTTSDHLKGTISKLCKLETSTTPTREVLTPPASQTMVLPITDTLLPLETFGGNVYLKIVEDAMEKFSPTGKMNDIFAQLAEKFREKEETPTPDSMALTNDPIISKETAEAHALTDEGEGYDGEGSNEAEVPGKEVVPEQTRGKITKGNQEVITLEEDESEDGEETLSQRATRRNLQKQKRSEDEDLTGRLGEDTNLAAMKLGTAERKIKGKQSATTSKGVNKRSTSQGVVIQEPTEGFNISPHLSNEGQEDDPMEISKSEGVYEKLKVTIDHKLLEAMVYFKDPIKQKNCAGR